MSYQRSSGVVTLGITLLMACLFWTNSASAQSAGQTASTTPPPAASSSSAASDEGKEIGGFQVTQSIEVGGRISDVSGSQPMYDTLVNDQSGLRILEQSLIMQSISHQDVFDTLTLNSFGWGGDPEQAARVRVSKYHWYTFSGSYQHMQNYFDYDLFANPLNPPTGSPPLPILNSPHGYYNRQNLYNFDLVVLPMHRVSFRLDYNRNRFDGPAFSSIHEGTEALLNESTDNTLNGFRFGVDVRATKKTTLSYTQLLQYYDGGTTYGLNSFNSYPLSNGTPVSLGLPWFNNGSPCSMPLMNGIANPTCNGFLNYSLDQHINTFIPTEQFNLASSSIKHLDFNGQFQYSHAQMNTPFTEVFSGLTSRSASLGSDTAGSNSSAKWNSASADVSATYHITDKLRLVETFRFRNFSVSGDYLDLQTNYFAAAGTTGSLLTPVATFPTSLSHTSNSPADIINEINASLTAQNMKQNDFQVQYDVSRWFGVRAGFDWDNYTIQPGESYQAALGDIYYPTLPNRGNCAGLPLNPNGSCTFTGVLVPWEGATTEINDYSGVLGVWFRKGSILHANLNAKFGGADNWIYRIDPLASFNIAGNISYSPHPWLTVGANLKFQQGKNNVSDINYNQHNYSTVLNAMINPNKYWGLEVAYNFDAIQQNMFICFAGTVTPADTTTCPEDPSLMQTYGFYHTHTQFGYFALTLTPIQRVTLHMGYTMVDNQGNTTSLNTLQPLGPLSSTYQSPLAAVEVGVHKDVTFKGAWNYYQYGEGSFVGPTAPRYFHANNTTLALRYAF
ncbi:MAG: hypothetical protein WAL85_05750 [Candidatus Korobacteraceae bacterium]